MSCRFDEDVRPSSRRPLVLLRNIKFERDSEFALASMSANLLAITVGSRGYREIGVETAEQLHQRDFK